jgi:hypothetical protein
MSASPSLACLFQGGLRIPKLIELSQSEVDRIERTDERLESSIRRFADVSFTRTDIAGPPRGRKLCLGASGLLRRACVSGYEEFVLS